MCELLVRVVDKTHPNTILDARTSKAGDVIVICDDGWRWGAKERESPFRIIAVPGEAPERFAHLLANESHLGPDYLQRERLWTVACAQLTDTMTAETLEAAAMQKPPLHDPRVIG